MTSFSDVGRETNHNAVVTQRVEIASGRVHPCGKLSYLSPLIAVAMAFVKAHLGWTPGAGLVPVLEAGQDVDRGGRREEALHGGPRHTGIRREGPEGLVGVVEHVVDPDEIGRA